MSLQLETQLRKESFVSEQPGVSIIIPISASKNSIERTGGCIEIIKIVYISSMFKDYLLLSQTFQETMK